MDKIYNSSSEIIDFHCDENKKLLINFKLPKCKNTKEITRAIEESYDSLKLNLKSDIK